MAVLYSSLLDKHLLRALVDGHVGIMPTDTVYGLVCSAKNPVAAERLYMLKNRDKKPGTIIAADLEQLVSLGIPRRYLKAVEQFWPGAISVIIPTGNELLYLHRGLESLVCRLPKDQEIHDLLEITGPLLTTSANLPGDGPASTISQAKNCFKETLDFYVDGPDFTSHKPSTIIRVIDDAIEIVRPGAVEIDESGRILRQA